MKAVKIIAITLFLIFAPLSIAAMNEVILVPEIDLERGYIVVEGVGLPPKNVLDTDKFYLARLAAKLDAQRNLLKIIANLRLDSQVSETNYREQDILKTQIDGIIKNMKIISESESFKDGIYRLKMEIRIKTLTPVVYPTAKESSVSEEKYPVTGLIIEANQVNGVLTEPWEIRDTEGKLIYSSTRALYYPEKSLFFNSQEQALQGSLAGNNPLMISCIRFKDSILLVSPQDGQLILNVLQDTDVFLLSKIAVIIGGSK